MVAFFKAFFAFLLFAVLGTVSVFANYTADDFFGANRGGSAWTKNRTGSSFCDGVNFRSVVVTGGTQISNSSQFFSQSGTIFHISEFPASLEFS